MDIQLVLVPYDTARRGWRSGAGPEHLLRAGLWAMSRDRMFVLLQESESDVWIVDTQGM